MVINDISFIRKYSKEVDICRNARSIRQIRFFHSCICTEMSFRTSRYTKMHIDRYAHLCGITYGQAFAECKVHANHNDLILNYVVDEKAQEIDILWKPEAIPLLKSKHPKDKIYYVDLRMDAVSGLRQYKMYAAIQQHLIKNDLSRPFRVSIEELCAEVGHGTDFKYGEFRKDLLEPTLAAMRRLLAINLTITAIRRGKKYYWLQFELKGD